MSEALKLGIVGGCLGALSRRIAPSETYHRILTNRIRAEDDVRVRVVLGRFINVRQVLPECERLIREKQVDGLLYQIRAAVFFRKALLWWRSVDEAGHAVAGLHPRMFRRSDLDWPRRFDRAERTSLPGGQLPAHDTPVAPWRRYTARTNVNAALGVAAGLHRWAIRSELALIAELERLCRAHSVAFFVFGPLSRPTVWTEQIVCQMLDRALDRSLPALDVPFARNIQPWDDAGQFLFFEDRAHVNARGHQEMARRLHPMISGWARGCAVDPSRVRDGRAAGPGVPGGA